MAEDSDDPSISPAVLTLCCYWHALRILGFTDDRIDWSLDVDLKSVTVFDLPDRANPHDEPTDDLPLSLVLAIPNQGGFYIPCGRIDSREQAEADIDLFYSLEPEMKRRIVQSVLNPKEVLLLGKNIAQLTEVPLFKKFPAAEQKLN
jgi:hypothetical protein